MATISNFLSENLPFIFKLNEINFHADYHFQCFLNKAANGCLYETDIHPLSRKIYSHEINCWEYLFIEEFYSLNCIHRKIRKSIAIGSLS